jgi:hypothetical protein
MARDDAGESRPAQRQQPSEPATAARNNGSRDGRYVGAGAVKRPEEAEQLRQAMARLERENRRLRKRCEEAELEINYLERSLKNTENTLSFRLGYALIHSTKSLDALRSLPSALLELSRDSRRRRRDVSPGNLALALLRGSVRAIGMDSRLRPTKEGGSRPPPAPSTVPNTSTRPSDKE